MRGTLIVVLLLLAVSLQSTAADLSIVTDLDSIATNGPDSTGIDEGDTVFVRVWITGADSLFSFGITFGDTTGTLEWVEETAAQVYATPSGWTDVAIQSDTFGYHLIQSTDFSVSSPLHSPTEVARLKFKAVVSGQCPELVLHWDQSGWLDTDAESNEFAKFEGAKICVSSQQMMGGSGGFFAGGGLSSDADWTATGSSAADSLGTSVATAGDINGDGYSDVLVGAPHYLDAAGDTMGAVYLYLGSETGILVDPDTIIVGGDEHAQFGFSVSSAGDVTGDGVHDFLVGAPEYVDVASNINGGAVFVYRWDGQAGEVVIDTILSQNRAGSEFGFSVA